MKKLLFISLVILAFGNTQAQERSFKATVDREAILIGEQLNLKLELRSHAADTAVLPFIGDTIIQEVEVVSASKIDTAFEGNDLSQRVLTQNFVLTSFDSGYYAIAPLQATINGDSIESNPFLVAVQTVPIDTAKGIYDIRGIAEVPFSLVDWLKENWPWIAGALGLIGLIVALYFFLKKRPKPEPVIKPIPTLPAHEIALERLDELTDKKLWQASKTKDYYSELTDILREYIENRFRIPALEQTTDQIITSMKRMPDFNPETIDQTKRLLFLADLVKFAKENPVGSENEMHLTNVRDFIMKTKLAEKAEPAENEKPHSDA